MKDKNYKDDGHLKDMKNWGRKGQLAIFVIIAIVILAIIIVVLIYPRIQTQFSGAFSPQAYLRDCVQPDLEPIKEKIMSQGGYLNPEGFFYYNETKLKYLCYVEGFYKTCVIQQPALVSHVQEEITNAIQPKLAGCFQNLKQEYERRGYSVSAGEPKLSVELQPGALNLKFMGSMTVTKDVSQTFKEFNVKINSRLYDLLAISTSILDFEATYGDSETTVYMQYYPNLKIEKIKLSDGTKIYRVSDVTTKETFSFASRSLSWPPGYGA